MFAMIQSIYTLFLAIAFPHFAFAQCNLSKPIMIEQIRFKDVMFKNLYFQKDSPAIEITDRDGRSILLLSPILFKRLIATETFIEASMPYEFEDLKRLMGRALRGEIIHLTGARTKNEMFLVNREKVEIASWIRVIRPKVVLSKFSEILDEVDRRKAFVLANEIGRPMAVLRMVKVADQNLTRINYKDFSNEELILNVIERSFKNKESFGVYQRHGTYQFGIFPLDAF